MGLLAKRPPGRVTTVREGVSNGLLLAGVPVAGAAGHRKYGTEHLRTDAIAQLLGFGLVDAVRVTRGAGPFVPSVPTPFSSDPDHNVAAVRLDYIFVSADPAPST